MDVPIHVMARIRRMLGFEEAGDEPAVVADPGPGAVKALIALSLILMLQACSPDGGGDDAVAPPGPTPSPTPSVTPSPTPASGVLDPDFSVDGKATLSFSSSADTGRAMALQQDGRIVIAGYSQVGGTDFDISAGRLDADGSPDTTFSGDGMTTTPVAAGTGIDMAEAVALQDDGKIVVAGSSSSDFAVVRYNVDGTLDLTFDADGKVTTAVGPAGDSATAVAVQADGRIVVAGTSSNGTDSDFAVVRYNGDGSLDATFDGDGKVTVAVGAGNDTGRAIAIQPDGKIVVVGWAFGASDNDVAAIRLNADGSLDTTFSGDGRTMTHLAANDSLWALALQSDGKIVSVGTSFVGADFSTADFVVVRYEADGTLDATFDGDGVAKTDASGNEDELYAVAIQADGAIVGAGKSFGGMAVARYTTAGALDTTFDGDGVALATFPAGSYAMGVAVQSDLKIVAAGTAPVGPKYVYAAARFK